LGHHSLVPGNIVLQVSDSQLRYPQTSASRGRLRAFQVVGHFREKAIAVATMATASTPVNAIKLELAVQMALLVLLPTAARAKIITSDLPWAQSSAGNLYAPADREGARLFF
jgi:hypothetical protein